MSNNKSDKFSKAVANARNESLPATQLVEEREAPEASEADEMGLALAQLTNVDIKKFDAASIVKAIKDEGFVAAERFLTMETGQMISGFLTGKGTTTIVDKRDGREKQVMRYRFELASGARVSLISNVMLDSAFENDPANGTTAVILAKGELKRTNKGNNMYEWNIFMKPGARMSKSAALPAAEAPAS